MKVRTYSFIALGALLMLFLITSCGNKKENETENQTSETTSENVAESNLIYTDLTLERVQGLNKGDTLTVSLTDGDEVYRLAVRDNKETLPGIQSIRADVEDKETGAASIFIRDGKLSGSMQLYGQDLYYTIKYDSVQASYYLMEIPEGEREELPGSAPLVPKH
ncbi:hypothetical protein [Gracilimonas sp.]|uniref:hypothetical protein n=1 Tax=Gracilimonas sp. TaxID=1974203 RepID=UPI0028724041|nr:hypothetical protein [Gracilimonas sp.]